MNFKNLLILVFFSFSFFNLPHFFIPSGDELIITFRGQANPVAYHEILHPRLILGIQNSFAYMKPAWQADVDRLEKLADPKISETQKSELTQQIIQDGVIAIPVLIEQLKDQRVVEINRIPSGSCYNLPPNTSASSQCSHPSPSSVTLGEKCEEILYTILTPNYSSPYAKGKDRGKIPLIAGRPFVIKDWQGWWKKYQTKTLEELHSTAKNLIDEFWKRGWDKSSVEWK